MGWARTWTTSSTCTWAPASVWGWCLNGRLYRGARGAAGEVGYLPIVVPDPHGAKVDRRGALEGALGASGVVEVARAEGMEPPLTAKRIFDAARDGSAPAERTVATVARRIALAIAAVVAVVDPELVILGGGVGRNGDLLLDPVLEELRALSPFHPRLEVSALGEDAELVGAVSMALDAAQDQLFERKTR